MYIKLFLTFADENTTPFFHYLVCMQISQFAQCRQHYGGSRPTLLGPHFLPQGGLACAECLFL